MSAALVVFEDEGHAAFEIVAAVRGVFDLRCGAHTLLERHLRVATGPLALLCRDGVRAVAAEAHPGARFEPPDGPALFVNARLLALGDDLARLSAGPSPGFARWAGDALAVAACDAATASRLWACLESRLSPGAHEPLAPALARACPELAPSAAEFAAGSCLIDHAWDLVRCNGAALCDDFRRQGGGIDPQALVYPGVHLLQDGAIRIESGCRVSPGVVLDAEDGPITLASGAIVQPQVLVRGPAYIGPQTVLKAGAQIHEGTSLGPRCKIGGEVEETVVQGFSNKQHGGFLGHAWIGEWVNLGAGTNNSDLKNNYSRVRMWEAGRMQDTGMQFAGLVAGDHVKSAIGTLFNTGTVAGVASQIFGSGFPPKFVAPFSWGGAAGFVLHDWERAAGTMRAVMQRRGVAASDAYLAAMRRVYEQWERFDRTRSE